MKTIPFIAALVLAGPLPSDAYAAQTVTQSAPTSDQRAMILNKLIAADEAFIANDNEVALKLAREAEALANELRLPDQDVQMLSARGLIGSSLVQLGRSEEAVTPLRAVYDGWSKNGENTQELKRNLITAGLNLATCLSSVALQDPSVLDEAELVLRDTLGRIESLRRAQPPGDVTSLPTIQADLATTQAMLLNVRSLRGPGFVADELTTARAIYKTHSALFPSSLEALVAANALALKLSSLSRRAEALEVVDKALGEAPTSGPARLLLEGTKATVLESAGRLSEAWQLRRGLELRLTGIEAAANQGNLGLTLARLGRFQEAEDAYRDAITNYQRLGSAGKVGLAVTRDNLAVLLIQSDKAEQALPLLTAAVQSAPEDEDITLARRINLAIALADVGRIGDAEREMRTVLAAFTRLQSAKDRPREYLTELAGAATTLALLQAGRGFTGEAAEYYQQALIARRDAECLRPGENWSPLDTRKNCSGSPEFVNLAWDAAWISLLRGERRPEAAHRVLQAAARQNLMRTLPLWPNPDAQAELMGAQSVNRDAVTAAWAINEPTIVGDLVAGDIPRADVALVEADQPGPS